MPVTEAQQPSAANYKISKSLSTIGRRAAGCLQNPRLGCEWHPDNKNCNTYAQGDGRHIREVRLSLI